MSFLAATLGRYLSQKNMNSVFGASESPAAIKMKSTLKCSLFSEALALSFLVMPAMDVEGETCMFLSITRAKGRAMTFWTTGNRV